jgi:hypothetical protein
MIRLNDINLLSISLKGISLSRISLGGSSGGGVPPVPPLKPIASYRTAGKTNEDADRAVLKDLTGNGHDLQLKNFAWAEGSGYGLYQLNWAPNKWIKPQDRADITYTDHSFNTSKIKDRSIQFYYQSIASESPFTIPSYIIRVSGLKDGQVLNYKISNPVNLFQISQDGVYTLPSFEFAAKGAFYGFQFNKPQESCNITIEQIPEYEGALVFDGVDDYGICEDFPALKDFTIIYKRINLNPSKTNQAFISNRSVEITKRLIIEHTYPNANVTIVGNVSKSIVSVYDPSKKPVYVLPTSYNGQISLGKPTFDPIIGLILGNYPSESSVYCWNGAFYALDIYDKTLEGEELQTALNNIEK